MIKKINIKLRGKEEKNIRAGKEKRRKKSNGKMEI